nr:radical SAM protein [Fundidesulfovibrio soli]
MQVEVTNRCNINCTFCSRHSTELKLGDMDPALCDKVVELSGTVQEIALFGYGEPIMSRAFHDMLPRLRCGRVGFFTNGLLMDAKMYRRIVSRSARPLAYVVFSVDGATAETYESIRAGSDFGKVWGNLREVVKERDASGSSRPHIHIEFVTMRGNVAELPALVRMADEAGVDAIKASHLVAWDEDMAAQSLLGDPALCAESFAQAAMEARDRRIRLELPKIFGQTPAPAALPPCRYPWQYAMISFEGDVRACCFAPQYVMGNLREQSFDAIWNGGGYRKLRKALHGDKNPLPCLRCEERFRHTASPDENATYLKLVPRQK